jgi:hypothetical protein
MANITDKDIIQHLKEKIKFHENEAQLHQDEAKRLESLLTAFTHDYTSARGRKGKFEVVNETLETQSEQENGKPSQAPKKTSKPTAKDNPPLSVPEKYTDDLPINAKIAFALREIGSGFNEDIANAMAQYEPKSDAQKISKQISGVLSTLKSKGQLSVEKVGRKDKYSLVA